MTLAFDAMGKGGMGAATLLAKGSEGIDKWLKKVQEANVATREQIAIAQAMRLEDREWGLTKEGAEQRAFEKYGAAIHEAQEQRERNSVLSGGFWEGALKGYVGRLEQLGDWVGFRGGLGVFKSMFPEGYFESKAIQEAKKSISEYDAALDAANGRVVAANHSAADFIDKLNKQSDTIGGLNARQREYQNLLASDASLSFKYEAMAAMKAAEDREQEKKTRERIDATHKSNEELQFQIDTFGMAADEVKRYRMELDGVPEALIGIAQGRTQVLDKMKLGEELKSPLEKYQDDIAKIDKMFNKGEFQSPEDRALAAKAVAKRMRELMGNDAGFRLAPTALAGSNEAASLINRDIMQQRNANRDPLERLHRTIEQLKAEAAASRRTEEKIAQILEQNGIGILTGRGTN